MICVRLDEQLQIISQIVEKRVSSLMLKYYGKRHQSNKSIGVSFCCLYENNIRSWSLFHPFSLVSPKSHCIQGTSSCLENADKGKEEDKAKGLEI